jgi:hypothetical protein
MSIRYPKNVIVGFSVVAALLAATVLLGGYANSNQATTDSPAMACQASGTGCPMMASSAANPQMMATQAESTDCPKPCCAGEKVEGACDNPCPIPCPKPCCTEDAPKGCYGAAEAAGCSAAEVTE